MSSDRAEMERALAERVVPALRERGFRGSLPHFRRVSAERSDLLTFQFDKWGGGFVIELGSGPPDAFTTPWGKVIPATKLTSFDLPAAARARLQPGQDGSTDSWFRYEESRVRGAARFDRVAAAVLELLPQAEAWWQGARSQANILSG